MNFLWALRCPQCGNLDVEAKTKTQNQKLDPQNSILVDYSVLNHKVAASIPTDCRKKYKNENWLKYVVTQRNPYRSSKLHDKIPWASMHNSTPGRYSLSLWLTPPGCGANVQTCYAVWVSSRNGVLSDCSLSTRGSEVFPDHRLH